MDARVRDAIATRGLAASRIMILEVLLKLRQVCYAPRLVRLDAARKVTESAKRARLLALFQELDAEGRKVLIYSQFVKMLKPIESDVPACGWDYAMLRGPQPDRRRHRHRLRSVMEPGGGTSGHGPGPLDRVRPSRYSCTVWSPKIPQIFPL